MDMLSDYDNLDVMLGNENNNPIERELAEAIDQSSAHGDDDTNVYHENEFRDYLHENEPLRQNEVRQSFEAFSSEFNLRLSQEMESMMSIMHSQINRAITTAIAERVIPEIQNIANSMSSMGHRDTEASSSPNSQENRENASGPKIKITKKDSRSVGDLRDAMGHGSYNQEGEQPILFSRTEALTRLECQTLKHSLKSPILKKQKNKSYLRKFTYFQKAEQQTNVFDRFFIESKSKHRGKC